MGTLKIKTKLTLLIVLPLVGLFLFSALETIKGINQVNSLNSLDKGIHLSLKISKLVHETQKERGMTAGFLGSNGSKFSNELSSQRELTNKRIDEIKEFVSQNDFSEINDHIYKKLKSALSDLENIGDTRSSVSSMSISGANAIGYYTKMNEKFLTVVDIMTEISRSERITQELVAYANFLQAKERAGVERAIGANTLATDKFTGKNKVKFSSLIAFQEAFLSNFNHIASRQALDFYNQTVRGNDIDEVNRIRSILLNKDDSFGVEATYWFSKITGKIGKLKEVDDFLADELVGSIDKELSSTSTVVYTIIALAIILIIVVIVLSVYVLKDITSKLKSLDNGVLRLLETNDSKNRIKVETVDEIGIISTNFNKYLQTIEDNMVLDMKVIGETVLTLDKVEQGIYKCRVRTKSNTPMIETLRNTINKMLDTLNQDMLNLRETLEQYADDNYLKKIEINPKLKGDMLKVLESVSFLGDSLSNSAKTNLESGQTLESNALTMNQSIQNVAHKANEQAASLEETAAAVEEITSITRNNDENATKMANLGNTVKSAVTTGQGLASKTATSMDEINTEVNAINDAITVIDQIAFQTNILSLNAAVEAATAGEAGKGFAVVASEVRNLAGRSAEAAKEIKDLVENATNKANEGKKISDDMIKGYEELNTHISETINIIGDVSSASKEQMTGIEQINDAVTMLDRVTQENASEANSVSSIASEVANLAEELVSDAQSKEFAGKNEIISKKASVQRTTSKPKASGSSFKSKTNVSRSKPAASKPDPIVSQTSGNDEWESF